MTETECALPSGWGVSVKAVRYFLTKERFDYAVAYDYIQLNASSAKVGAYFETDYMPKGNTHVVSDYTPQEKGRTTTVFCSRGTSSSAKSYTLFYFSNYFRFDCGNTVVQTKSDTFNYNTRYVVSTGPGLTVSNVATSTSTTYAHDPVSLEAATPLYLFASHLNGSGFDNIAKGQARYVRVYESDNGTYDATTMVREYIPVLNPTTGKGALYDTVGRTFLEPTRLGCAEGSAQDCSYVGPHMRDFEVIAGTDTIGYSPRTLTVDSVAKESGATKVTLSVSEGALVTDTLVAALGAYDCGPSFSKWPKASVEILAAVSPAAQQMTVTLPSGWGSDYAAARFFLVHSQPVSLEVVDSIKGDGTAYVDLGRKGTLGDIVQLTIKGTDKYEFLFGARESAATTNNFTVNYGPNYTILDYSDYTLSRGVYNAVNNVWSTIYMSPAERSVYEGYDRTGALKPIVSGSGSENRAKLVDKDFTTVSNLLLYNMARSDETGNKFSGSVRNLYLWHADGATTNLVMDLVPVRNQQTGKGGFYDRVSKMFLGNVAASGALTAEGSVKDVFFYDAEKILDDEGQAVSMPVFVSEVKACRHGDIAKIKVTAPDGLTWHVSAVYGETDLGSDPKAWGTNVVIVTDGTGTGSGRIEWKIPAGLVKKQMRFFLSSAAPFETYSHLTGDGTAYLNLGRKGVQGDMVSMSVQYCNYKNSLIFGSREASESKNFTILGYQTLYLDYCNYNDSRCTAGSYQSADLLGHWITFFNSPNLRQIWKDGVSVATDPRAATGNFETLENLYLFSVSGNPPTATSPFAGYIKDFVLQHTDGSVTNDVMRLTPVYDAESEKYAMYDEVSDSIFFNVAASGSFSVDGAASTGKRAYPAYHFVGCSPLMTKGCGMILVFR